MANLRDIRRRIKSIKNTAQITKAMQMVAASRMRKAQQAALAGRPYATRLDELGAHLHDAGSDFTHPLLEEREVKKICALVVTTDKGLCGALNTNLLREVLKQDKPNKVYVTAGRKGRQFLARSGKTLLADFEFKDTFTFRDSKRISAFLIDGFIKHDFDAVEIHYTRFINTINQKPTMVEILPIGVHKLDAKAAITNITPGDYLFEPSGPELLAKLLPFYVHYETYQTLLDSKASEHSARMVAMKNATDNAKQLVKDLTLEYNKARQAMITTELLEISTAQAALG